MTDRRVIAETAPGQRERRRAQRRLLLLLREAVDRCEFFFARDESTFKSGVRFTVTEMMKIAETEE